MLPSMKRGERVCCAVRSSVKLSLLVVWPSWFCWALQLRCGLEVLLKDVTSLIRGLKSLNCKEVSLVEMSWKLQLSSLELVEVGRVSWAWAPLGERDQKRAGLPSARLEEVDGKRMKRGRSCLILERWPHRSWGAEWPIVVDPQSLLSDCHTSVTWRPPAEPLGDPCPGSSGILQDKGTCGFRLCLHRGRTVSTNTMSQQLGL